MRKSTHRDYVLYLVLILALITLFWYLTGSRSTSSVSYSRMVQLFEAEQVESFTVQNNVVEMKLKEPLDGKEEAACSISSFDAFYSDLNDLIQKQKADGTLTDYDYKKDTQPINWLSLLPSILSLVMVFLVLMMLVRQNNAGNNGGLSQFGKAKFTSADQMKKKVTFHDVAGAEEEKGELEEVVDFLKDPAKYTVLGARIPKGILLVGPPGTGKTLLAKAVAGEAGVPFLSISGSDFVELYVGVGASRVRDLFEEAKKTAPSIVFIDEIDAVGRQRGAGLGGGHDEREQTLNQLLVEMDGFEGNSGVIVLAATNRVDILDPALLRPGRFDRQIYVGLPDIKGRTEVLKVHSRKKPLAEDVNLATLAKATGGFTGADLENLMNEGALLAARKNQPCITMEDLHEATIKVIAGPEKKSQVVTPHARKLTAYHEAGHAIAMHALPTHDPVHQITIVPRGQAGGMTIALPQEDKVFRSRNELFEDIVALLGGRVAEDMVLGDISTGASSDLQRATAIAHAMVAKYGMSDQLGAVVYDDQKGEVFIGRSMAQSKPYSESVAAAIDHEVKTLIDRAYEKCQGLLKQYLPQLEITAQYLLEHETMSAADFEAVFSQDTPGALPLDPASL
ncbi:MAG: ATP-dependent zinc metalloprotease FtsH [Clostridiales bacterium]|nr:MAG: ATP-dependent zinc metalloprotease FtsH [Clostridiales bacterium]